MRFRLAYTLILLPLFCQAQVTLKGIAQPGGILFGQAPAGSRIQLDGKQVPVASDGHFVIGFGRDAKGSHQLSVNHAEKTESQKIILAPRKYKIEKINGLPASKVSPQKPEVLARIKREGAAVAIARTRRDKNRLDYLQGFIWPVNGRLSGFYGSQRILNGIPKRPHYGLDIAASTGTPVKAPAAGIITLAEPDLYYSGGTVILDHGQGFSSTFLHMSQVEVKSGQRVEQGDIIGRVGATGRASGPHLDWRMNWLGERVDPQPLMTTIE